METAYRTSPFFEFYEDDLRPLFEGDDESLLNFNLKTIQVVGECLGIQIPMVKTTNYEIDPENILDARFLVEAKKEKDFSLESYPQVFEERHGFIPNLSVLDLLFNEGTNALEYLRTQSLDLSHA